MQGSIRRMAVAALAVAAGAAATGCAAMSNAEKGAVIGGLAGAGLGRAIGHHNGNEARGGFAGAGIGALIGGLLGANEDLREERRHTVAPVDFDDRRAFDRRVEYDDLPPIPRPRHTVTRTTRVYRTYEVPVEEREVIIIDDRRCR